MCGCGNNNCGGNCDWLRRMPAAVVAEIPKVQKFAGQNCKQYGDRLTECMLEEIELTQRTPTVGGVLTPLTPIGAKQIFGLDTPVGQTWHFILFPAIAYAHVFCLREAVVTNATGGSVAPTLMGVAATKLYCSPDQRAATAFNWAITEKPVYTATTVWRCACNRLCIEEGVGESETVAALFLLPTVGGPYTVTADGFRMCWGKAPGPCPPGPLCGRVPFLLRPTGVPAIGAPFIGEDVPAPPPEPIVGPAPQPNVVGPEQLLGMLTQALQQGQQLQLLQQQLQALQQQLQDKPAPAPPKPAPEPPKPDVKAPPKP